MLLFTTGIINTLNEFLCTYLPASVVQNFKYHPAVA